MTGAYICQVLASLENGVEGVAWAEVDVAESFAFHAALPVLADSRRLAAM